MPSKPAKTAASKKAPKAAPAKKAAAKAAKPAPKPAAKKAAAKPAAAPPQDPKQDLATQEAHAKAVERQLEKAEHQHQDPRGPAHEHNPAAQAHARSARLDGGAIKNRGVPRMNKIVNWFRRGAGR